MFKNNEIQNMESENILERLYNQTFNSWYYFIDKEFNNCSENLISNFSNYGKEALKTYFNYAVLEFIKEINNNLVLGNDYELDIDINRLKESLSNQTKYFIEELKLDGWVYIDKETSPARLLFKNDIVIQAQGMESFSLLSNNLRKPQFNNIFVGWNLFELNSLIKLLGIFPSINDYNKIVNKYIAHYNMKNLFIQGVIITLINNATKLVNQEDYDVEIEKAKIIAKDFNVNFDFDKYLNVENMKLVKTVDK